jgi:protein-L-isoaspartate(D-aspartate) O-methyltransferase
MEARQALVDELEREGISDPRVLQAMRAVERHRFVPSASRADSYANFPLSIGSGQTISQPYIVAYMSELAALDGDEAVLEVGTGSGYQAAVLAELLGLGPASPPGGPEGRLCSIEILPELASRAEQVLAAAGYSGIELAVGDGSLGWPERAPFDVILVTAAPGRVPPALCEQLAPGGRLVIPVGEEVQYIELITRQPDGSLRTERRLPVRFVPMTGEAR